MALPPEQINIKRRREEEPVETLYIQSALHKTKRRFTDFVFQRVLLNNDDGEHALPSSQGPAPADPAAQRALRSPRSVSSLQLQSQQTTSPSGVPVVRATSPGAELRDAKRLAAKQKEVEERYKRALYSSPSSLPSSAAVSGTSKAAAPTSRPESGAPSRAHSLRRFQISRSSSPSLSSLRGATGGIQKWRANSPAPGVAVLVEQLRRRPRSRQAEVVADLAVRAQADGVSVQSADAEEPAIPARSRKRPVVNEAERRWKEERKGAISAAKQHLSDTLEKSAQSNWDDERLAREFEQIALELDRTGEMEVDSDGAGYPNVSTLSQQTLAAMPKPILKHQPRLPKQPRAVQPTSQPLEENGPMEGIDTPSQQPDADDSDADYVYDVYIRRPLDERETLTNPLAEFKAQQKLIDPSPRPGVGVGVIVITPEDEEYWEHFVEDDEEEWDSEDADSNAENNPANDYPDEELSFDEDDDPSAVYGRYPHRAASDDEGFDFDDSASEGAGRFGAGYARRFGDVDSDEDF